MLVSQDEKLREEVRVLRGHVRAQASLIMMILEELDRVSTALRSNLQDAIKEELGAVRDSEPEEERAYLGHALAQWQDKFEPSEQ